MSVSTSITFLKNRAYHKQMLDAVKALIEVKVEQLPRELSDYFGVDDPNDALNDTEELLEVASTSIDYPGRLPYIRKDDTEYENAIEIDLDKLPANVKHIRVSRS